MSKEPEIRFKDFADNTYPWEQRKFGEVFTSLQNNTLSRAELSNEPGAAQSIHYGDVLIKYDEVLNVSDEPLAYIANQSVADKFRNSYLQNGDIVIADTAEDETVGKCTEIKGLTDQKIVSGLHTIPVRANKEFASGFLGFYLNSGSYHDQLRPLMQGIKVTSISKGALQDTIVKYPSDLKEQASIGNFFESLDNFITLHQRKLTSLRAAKSSLLLKMFPSSKKEGKNKERELVPAVRFRGFEREWEEKKLGDMCSITTGTLDANAAVLNGKYAFFTCGKETLHTNTYAFNGPSILINGNGDLGYTRKYTGKFNAYQRTYVLQKFSEDIDYIEYAIHCYLPDRIKEESFGGAMPYIRLDALSELVIPIPSLAEQRAIGSFFSSLDRKIEGMEKELTALKKMKEAYLGKMFPASDGGQAEKTA